MRMRRSARTGRGEVSTAGELRLSVFEPGAAQCATLIEPSGSYGSSDVTRPSRRPEKMPAWPPLMAGNGRDRLEEGRWPTYDLAVRRPNWAVWRRPAVP